MPVGFTIRLAVNDDIPAIRAVLLSVRSEYGVLGEIGADDADLDDLALNYFAAGDVSRSSRTPRNGSSAARDCIP